MVKEEDQKQNLLGSEQQWRQQNQEARRSSSSSLELPFHDEDDHDDDDDRHIDDGNNVESSPGDENNDNNLLLLHSPPDTITADQPSNRLLRSKTSRNEHWSSYAFKKSTTMSTPDASPARRLRQERLDQSRRKVGAKSSPSSLSSHSIPSCHDSPAQQRRRNIRQSREKCASKFPSEYDTPKSSPSTSRCRRRRSTVSQGTFTSSSSPSSPLTSSVTSVKFRLRNDQSDDEEGEPSGRLVLEEGEGEGGASRNGAALFPPPPPPPLTSPPGDDFFTNHQEDYPTEEDEADENNQDDSAMEVAAVTVEMAVDVRPLPLPDATQRNNDKNNRGNNLSWRSRCLCVLLSTLLAGTIFLTVALLGGGGGGGGSSTSDENPNSSSQNTHTTASPTTREDWIAQKIQTVQDMVVEAMSNLSLQAGQETLERFQDNTTAQYLAAEWMATVDELHDDLDFFATASQNQASSNDNNDDGQKRKLRLLDRFVLVTLFQMSSASFTLLQDHRSTPNCNWKAVGTSSNDDYTATTSCIRQLDFNIGRSKLRGPLPSELALIPSLSKLYVSGNELTGTLPSVWALGLSELSDFRASRNGITGSIPWSWASSLSRIEYLGLDNNQLRSWWERPPLEEESGEATVFPSLKELHLEENLFSSTIPAEIFQFRSLQILYLRGNRLTGIPSNLTVTAPLNILDLSSNQLMGTIPPEIARPGSTLSLLTLNENPLLSGELPRTFKEYLPKLKGLNICDTAIQGNMNFMCQRSDLFMYAFHSVENAPRCNCCKGCPR